MNNYQTGLASLFSTHARNVPKYKIHRDHANNKWNVFRVENGVESFVCSFDELLGAQAYISETPLCTGTDPIRCDDDNCPVHGKRGGG